MTSVVHNSALSFLFWDLPAGRGDVPFLISFHPSGNVRLQSPAPVSEFGLSSSAIEG